MLQMDKEEEIQGQIMLPPSGEEKCYLKHILSYSGDVTKREGGTWSLYLISITGKITSAFEVGSLFSIVLLGLY